MSPDDPIDSEHDDRPLVLRAREALDVREYDGARSLFEAAIELDPSPEALEGLGAACFMLDDGPATLRARERAYLAYVDRDDRLAAARVATYLAWDSLQFRGEPAVANGWCRRAHRLIDDLPPSWEHGWLAEREGSMALFHRGDAEEAARLGAVAAEVGRTIGAADIEIVGNGLRGLALVTRGDLEEGMPLLDEAGAAAASGELPDVLTGLAGCYLMFACGRVRDLDRAGQWCRELMEIAVERGSRAFLPICRTQLADVLIWRGDWTEADRELDEATRELDRLRPLAASEAVVRVGELRRRQGRIDEARSLFERAEPHPLALIGLGWIALDTGDPERAARLAERALRKVPTEARTERAGPLELAVRARAAAGDAQGASAAAAELAEIARIVPTGPLRASAALAAGLAAQAAGNREAAAAHLEDAVDLYAAAGTPYEEAVARAALAGALAALGREREAGEERAAADAIRRSLEVEVQPAAAPRGPLTPRELDVLRLVAEGLSNAEIAERLTLSEHTVHRHVANILAKLGVPSRAAAVASAAQLDLL